MDEVVIYHNPRCSKSRAAMALLAERGIEPVVVPYLDDPPDEKALRDMLVKLNLRPGQLLRRAEPQARGLDVNDDDAVIAAMVQHPILIERPIVAKGDHAVIGRPAERVLELL